MSSGGGTPASLSWRVGGRSSPQHQRNTSSSLASAVLPAISIALPGGSNASSSASSSSSKLPMSSSSGGERGGEDPSSSTDDAGDSENPQLQQQQQANHHHSHSPFHIGPLRTDGKSGDDKRKQRSKVRKRDKLARAGRSLSPFRSMHGRSSSLNRLGEALASVRLHHHATSNQLLSPPKSGQASSSRTPSDDAASTTSAGEATEDDSTDTESVRSVGLAPRDTAFGSGRGGTGGDGDGDEDGGEHEDGEHRSSLDASESPSDGEGQAADDDSIIDFDDATIDNTLFNAGCLDLHNAWQNNKESIGEGGWYPDENDPSWDTTNDEDEVASRKLHHDASRHEGAMVDDPDDEGYTYQGARTAPVDGAAPLTTSGDHEEVTSPSHIDHHSRLPNVILPSSHRPPAPTKQGSKYISSSSHGKTSTSSTSEYSLVASRPIFAKNRCTITLVHGEYEKAVAEREQSGQGRMPRRWIVASDGSEESSYAIEWTIGTVLRDGDETLIVSVMETSEKLDGSHAPTSAAGKAALKEKQRIRQSMALVLARQATALLQRTRLAVKVSCQALHAKHARHMLLDLIDFYEPTMVIVGSRGLGSLKGILLGSTSHYLLQRSSKPIMIARKRLQLPPLPRGKGDVVSSVRRRHMRLDEAAIEKKSKVGEEGEDGEGETSEDDDAAAGQGEKTATDEQEGGEDSKEQGSSGDTVTQRREDDKARERTSAESVELRKEGQAAVAGKEEERLRESGDGDDQAEAKAKGPSSSEGEAATSSSVVEEDDAAATQPSGVAAAAASDGPSEDAAKVLAGEERGRRQSAVGADGEEEERGRSRSRARER